MKCDSTMLEMAVVNSPFTKRQRDTTTLNSAIYSRKSGHSSPGEKPRFPGKKIDSRELKLVLMGDFPREFPRIRL